MKVIGITGTLGAGKGAVVEYLEQKGFRHYSARAFILEEVKRRGLPINRDSTTMVANDLRSIHSPSYILEELYASAEASGVEKAILESIRTVGEVMAMRQKPHFFLVSINADKKIRYDRIVRRGSETDAVSFEKFLADEEREMHSSDPTKGNIERCMALADYRLTNNGTLEELHAEIETMLRAMDMK